MKTLAASTPFNRQIGIELTLVPSVYEEWMDNIYSENWHLLAEKYKEHCEMLNLPDACDISTDPGCIEWPSPILHSWREAKSFYTKAVNAAATVGLTPFQEDQEGGMGHIHMGMSRNEALMIMADIVYRPYLTWILATPNGSKFCQSIAGYMVHGGNCGSSNYNITTKLIREFDNGYRFEDSDIMGTRYVIANYNSYYKTLEFRAFDAADSWETQEEHIAFYQRYAEMCIKKYGEKHGPIVDKVANFPSKTGAAKIYKSYKNNKDLCIKDFKKLIVDELELPWERYEWYIERNLNSAFEFGDRL